MFSHVYRSALIIASMGAMLAAGSAQAREKLTGEQQLAKLLEGRVAEKPIDCIPIVFGDDTTTVIDKTAIVYGSTGSVIYVNRPTNPESLSSDDVLISHPTNDENCNIDTIQLRDRYTHTYDGFVGLQQFVPYRRIDKPS